MPAAQACAITAIRRDQSDDSQKAGVREKGGNLTCAANIFTSIFSRETQIGVKTGTQGIAIEDNDLMSGLEKAAAQIARQGGLPSARQSGKPENTGAVAICALALRPRNRTCSRPCMISRLA
jgi:hypothetical protein